MDWQDPTHRGCGVLLHPTSLPGPEAVGTLGEQAYNWVDLLAQQGIGWWQILPLGPTGYGDSPYSAFSAFAGNPLLIDLASLASLGELLPEELPEPVAASQQADYHQAFKHRQQLLPRALQRLQKPGNEKRQEAFARFCWEQGHWLEDYALFRALRHQQGERAWVDWPIPLRDRHPEALAAKRQELAEAINVERYAQFCFFDQWLRLKQYANNRGVRIFGDLPIFVAYDSSDVWARRDLFQLNGQGQPQAVAGVPPDYFSKTGQRWGNPLYAWSQHAAEDYHWWRQRLHWMLQLCDLIRIDHFRGFAGYWSVPAQEKTALNGHWEDGPGEDFFRTLQQDWPQLPIVAEDLGFITEDVMALRDQFQLPGMKVLQFAFDSDALNPYLPHNHVRQAVAYTGTHDNATTLGWWQNLDSQVRERIKEYLGHSCEHMPWDLIRCAMASVAHLTIIPAQDVVGLDDSARFNQPGTSQGNWTWRLPPSLLDNTRFEFLGKWAQLYGRQAPTCSCE